MKYLLLNYDDEQAGAKAAETEMPGWFEVTERMAKSGKMLGGEGLKETSTATTVRKRDGKLSTSDGPFAETKEQLCGFFLIEARDLDEAIELAGKFPHIHRGSVEIRPVRVFSEE